MAGQRGCRRETDAFPGARADEASTWGRRDSAVSAAPSGGGGGGGDSWGAPRRADTAAPSSGGERKRLQLQPRTKPAPVIKVLHAMPSVLLLLLYALPDEVAMSYAGRLIRFLLGYLTARLVCCQISYPVRSGVP